MSEDNEALEAIEEAERSKRAAQRAKIDRNVREAVLDQDLYRLTDSLREEISIERHERKDWSQKHIELRARLFGFGPDDPGAMGRLQGQIDALRGIWKIAGGALVTIATVVAGAIILQHLK